MLMFRLVVALFGLHSHFTAAFAPSLAKSVQMKGNLRRGSVENVVEKAVPILAHAAATSTSTSTTTASTPSKATDTLFQRIRQFQLWPSMFSLVVGYKIGMKVALKQATKTTTSALATTAPPAATITIRSIVLQAAVIALVTREFWRMIPNWVKRQIPFVRRRKNEPVVIDPNDLSSIASLSMKLQSLFAKIGDKLDDGAPEPGTAQASLLAMLMLIAQVKEQIPGLRDNGYDASGISVDNPAEPLSGMDEMFEFADWAYDEFTDGDSLAKALSLRQFSLLRHDKIALPGCAAHYIAISKVRKTALISIKGTSSFEDLLTDCCGQSVKFQLAGPFVIDGPTEIYGHEGILAAAQRLATDVEMLVEELLLPNNYKLLITGHSLGAGVAALLGVILRSKFPSLLEDNGSKLQVLAFASPPILNHDAALACSSFCTTIVNNSDVIPRASVCNLMILVEFLKLVGAKLEAKGMSPTDIESTGAFIRMLTKGSDGQLLMTQDEIRDGMRQSTQKVQLKDPDHLFVAGKVLHMYDLWSKVPMESANNAKEAESRTAERLRITDGTSSMLQYIELDERMVTDHLSPSYRSSIKSLLHAS